MDNESTRHEIQELRAAIEAQRRELDRLTARLSALDQATTPSAGPAARPAFTDTLSKFAAFSKPATESDTTPKPIPPPVIVTPPPLDLVSPPRSLDEVSEAAEMRFGATWLNRIGAIILLLAVAFFVKFSFDQGWLGPRTRVLMGATAGLLMIAGGEYSLFRKLRQFAVGLLGAGVAMLYVSAFSAHAFYSLIDLNTAFTVYCGITALGTLLAVHGRIQAVAILTLIGAFLTPVVLSTGRNAQVELLTYLLIVDAGFLLVGAFRQWDALRALSWLGTLFMFLGWGFKFYEADALSVTLGFITAFYVLYHCEALISARLNWGEQRAVLPALVHLNNLVLVASVWWLADSTYHRWMGLFLALTGLAQWAFAWLIRRSDRGSLRTQTSLAIDGAFILALFAPVQFDNCSVAIAWGVQSVACLIAARWLPDAWLRVKAGAVLTAAALHLISIDVDDRALQHILLQTPNDLWHLNNLILCFVFVALCSFAGATCLKWQREANTQDSRLSAAFACLGVALLLGIAAHEYDRYVATMSWLVLFLVATGVGRWLPTARTIAIAIVFAAAAKYVAWDLIEATRKDWAGLQGVVFNRAIYCGIAVAAACALVRRNIGSAASTPAFRDWADLRKSVAAVLPAIILFAGGTFEIMRVFTFEPIGLAAVNPKFAMQLWLSMFWGVTAIGSLTAGMLTNQRELRYLAMVIFAATVLKAFVIDLNYLRMIYRVISFAVLGVLLLLASLFYQKRWSRLHRVQSDR